MAIRKASMEAAMARARSVNPHLFDRMMSKVIFGQGTECWYTTLAKDTCGYTALKNGSKKIKSHRLVHSLFYPGVEAPVVRHICNNPGCVNPAHLRAGTPKDNAQDRMIFGRGGNLKGTNNGRAKLTLDQVIHIRSSTEKNSILAKCYGVTDVMISRIRLRKAWTHI